MRKQFISDYLQSIKQSLDLVPQDIIKDIVTTIHKATQKGKRIYIFGNGGSASTASHMASDLCKGQNEFSSSLIRAIALTESVPLMTAWANDASYTYVFAGQVVNHVQRGDVAIGISTSGKSRNIWYAITKAKDRGATTIGLTGFPGGQLKDAVDISLVIGGKSMEQVEDLHLIIGHIIALEVKALMQKHH